jgi:hypothetical protein
MEIVFNWAIDQISTVPSLPYEYELYIVY